MMRVPLLRALGALAFAIPAACMAASVAPVAGTATYGRDVRLELSNDGYPTYLPGTRYARRGNVFELHFEAANTSFGPFPPWLGKGVVSLGELPPGTYQVDARIAQIANPSAPVTTAFSTFTVSPPAGPGVYTVPRVPQALAPAHLLLNSATYIDPATLRVSMGYRSVRVDFEFAPDAPSTGPAPAGMVAYESVPLPPLEAGGYRVEAWGKPKGGGAAALYFTSDFVVAPITSVIEFYNEDLDHYFITARGEDIQLLDAGMYGKWKRTGQRFQAWSRAGAWAGTRAVCRFYAAAHNSHFFTADPAECDQLKAQESAGRADAQARKQSFVGWQYEGIAFHVVTPTNGSCPPDLIPVYRHFNDRVAQGDANHRFTSDPAQTAAMPAGWIDEGVAFCSPP